MTLSRKLTLHNNPSNGYIVKSYPLPAINEYEYATVVHDTMKNGMSLSSANYNKQRLEFKMPGKLDSFMLNFTNVNKESLKFSYDAKKNQFILDRTKARTTSFDPKFAPSPDVAPAILDDQNDVEFSIFMDESSVEIFIDHGATVMTDQIFPTTPFTALTLTSEKNDIANLKVSKVKRIWD